MQVKPLEWVPNLYPRQRIPRYWWAETPFGIMSIELKKKYWVTGLSITTSAYKTVYDTLEEAQDAAYKYFSGLVKDCIDVE